MPLGDDYATTAELKSEFRITDADDDFELAAALSAASTWVTTYCDRDFNQAAAASARIFYPANCQVVNLDDVATTTSLVVKTDEGDDGTYETTWTASDYQLEPLNQMANGLTGWPYTRLRAVGSYRFPTAKVAPVQVTAIWGWPSVPAPVRKATLLYAAALYKSRDSAEGVLSGFGDFGPIRVGTLLDNRVATLLAPFRKHPVMLL